VFSLSGDTVSELEGRSAHIEKSLRTLIETHPKLARYGQLCIDIPPRFL